ncbi:MAG: SRPBCC family protein [Actinomycetales bacterium]
MTVSRLSVEIAAPPAAVYAALADLPGYAGWLQPSRTYHATVDVSDTPVRQGSTYTDHTSGDVMQGQVLECEPDRLLLFRQSSHKGDLDITIRYQLTPVGSRTRVDRTGTIVTHGRYRLVHPVVVAVTKRENRRTLAALKAYLERGTPG